MDKEKLKEIGKICIPGMRLSPADDEHISGPGTYDLQGYIYATLAGILKTERDETRKVNNTILLFSKPFHACHTVAPGPRPHLSINIKF